MVAQNVVNIIVWPQIQRIFPFFFSLEKDDVCHSQRILTLNQGLGSGSFHLLRAGSGPVDFSSDPDYTCNNGYKKSISIFITYLRKLYFLLFRIKVGSGYGSNFFFSWAGSEKKKFRILIPALNRKKKIE